LLDVARASLLDPVEVTMSEAMVLACSFGLSGFSLLLLHLFEKS
jgi:hypothetical protein